MKIYSFLIAIIILLINANDILGQYGNFKMDNGSIGGYYGNNTNFEETVILKPTSPGIARKAYVYLSGTRAQKDTIWFVGDPAEGSFPPSLWCRYINSYMGVIINYNGSPAWYEIDLSTYKGGKFGGIPTGGINTLVVQHTIKPNGPYFTIDTQTQTGENANSFLNDVYKPNPNFYDIAGTIVGLTQGRYMIRLEMDYYYKDGSGMPISQPPAPTLVDETIKRGLTVNGNPIAFEMASVVDWNNDGYDDIAVGSNYFQNKKDGTFENINSKVNIQNGGSVWADIDNDGYKDFYAARGGTSDRIYYGKSDGTFEETAENIYAIDGPSISPIFFDYDGDGLLDLFIAYGRRTVSNNEVFYPDKLYKNLGARKFKDVTVESGISKGEPAPYYDAWGASVYDYNSDGLPDIFVATYRLAPDLLYKNNGDGTFTEVGASTGIRGAATNYENYFGHGMGSDWGNLYRKNDDVTSVGAVVGNLGHPDSRALASNPSLAWSNYTSNEKFTDITSQTELRFYEMNAGVMLSDLNNDRLTDVVHAQYAYYKKGAGKDKYSRFYLSNNDYTNSDVPVFEDKTWELGPRIHGAWSPVRGDFDNDGGVDVIVASSNQYAALYYNNIKRGNWISFKISGDGSNVNRDGFGTRINIYSGGKIFATAYLPGTVLNARAAQSSSDLHFGLGYADKTDSVVAIFRDGKSINYGSLEPNMKYHIKYDGTFTTFEQNKVVLISPAYNYHYELNSFGNFKWHKVDNAARYRFRIAKNDSFDQQSIVIDSEIVENGTMYSSEFASKLYWQVIALDDSGNEISTSDIWTFSIRDYSDVPSLIAPANDALNIPLLTEFRWAGAEYRKSVNLQIAANSSFEEPVIDEYFSSPKLITSYRAMPNTLRQDTKYYWRIRVADQSANVSQKNWSDWSEIFNFTTESGTSINDDKLPLQELAKFRIIGVYPNPIKAESGIEFEIPYAANLSVAIFDITGKMLGEIAAGYFEQGIHTLNYDFSMLPGGSYIIRITDGINISSLTVAITK